MECIEKADEATFIRCHLHAFEALGGIPRRCLYDNAKVVVLGRDGDGSPVWNDKFLDFALRLGFEAKLCRPYRPRTKGKVESGVKYVKQNFWLGASFAGLNQKARVWIDTVANVRVHGTTEERPIDRLAVEGPLLSSLPERGKLAVFLREERKVGRDGYVNWGNAFYGVHWTWKGQRVQVLGDETTVQIFGDEELLAFHAHEPPGPASA